MRAGGVRSWLRAELIPKILTGTARWDWDLPFFPVLDEDKPGALQGVESVDGPVKYLFFPIFFHICCLIPFSL